MYLELVSHHFSREDNGKGFYSHSTNCLVLRFLFFPKYLSFFNSSLCFQVSGTIFQYVRFNRCRLVHMLYVAQKAAKRSSLVIFSTFSGLVNRSNCNR